MDLSSEGVPSTVLIWQCADIIYGLPLTPILKFITPLLKHGQETKKVQDMRPVLAVSMVYGDTFQKK